MTGDCNGSSWVDPRLSLGDFETDLWLPRIAEGRWGRWSTRRVETSAARGYWGGGYRVGGTLFLMGPFQDDAAAWMSITPMEIESQEIGIASAHGHTAVLGLGMGWCAANVALNPAVDRVTVVERDPEIISLVETIGIFDQLPDAVRGKIEVVHGDALTWRPDAMVDTVQADIWAKFVEPQKWNDIRRIQDNIGAASIYFWGQEMELWRLACRARDAVPDRLDDGELAALIGQSGLPLIEDSRPDYPGRIAEASRWWTPRDDGWWETH